MLANRVGILSFTGGKSMQGKGFEPMITGKNYQFLLLTSKELGGKDLNPGMIL